MTAICGLSFSVTVIPGSRRTASGTYMVRQGCASDVLHCSIDASFVGMTAWWRCFFFSYGHPEARGIYLTKESEPLNITQIVSELAYLASMVALGVFFSFGHPGHEAHG